MVGGGLVVDAAVLGAAVVVTLTVVVLGFVVVVTVDDDDGAGDELTGGLAVVGALDGRDGVGAGLFSTQHLMDDSEQVTLSRTYVEMRESYAQFLKFL